VVAARPDRDEAEWWAGAPSVCRDDDGAYWMAARMRTAESPLGLRGYEVRIFHSRDGESFEAVHGIRREDVPTSGFERPALLRHPATGRFMLYGCSPIGGAWRILRFDDAVRPDRFAASSARIVIEPDRSDRAGDCVDRVPTGYKDPVVVFLEGRFHCYVIGIAGNERTYHFVSDDGETWEPARAAWEPILDLTGWHDHAVRPASVLPLGPGYLFVYEGSNATWPDPAYNVVTGLGYTMDLHEVYDMSPHSPVLTSPTPGRLPVWRYSQWLRDGDDVRVYAEVECSNGSHEIRAFRIPAGAGLE
jgi:hypothetical protein